MGITEIPAKSAFRQGLLSDSFTSSLASLSPYRGCGHGCLYCDGRAEKYFFAGDFATDIEVRAELPGRLIEEIPRLREQDSRGRKPLVSVGSGVTDTYQPLERTRKITRACAEVLAGSGQPCLVITKSSLVRRDLDLWTKVASEAGFVLLMTIAQVDDQVRKRFEPGASSLDDRWETLAAFRAAGAATGVLAMPLLPGISDDEKTLRALYNRATEEGVDFLLAGGLTLRPGRQKELYFDEIRSSYPSLETHYTGIYGENRPSGAPGREPRASLEQRIAQVRKDYRIPSHLPHRVLSRLVPSYESFYLLLAQMEQIYGDHREALPRLRVARERFGAWLSEKRTIFRRHRTFEPTWVEGEFRDLLAPGRIEALLGNEKLASFARHLSQGQIYDEVTRVMGLPG